MYVSAILVVILLAGGYALFLWLRQQRESRAPRVEEGRRSLASERDRAVQPIELTAKRRPAAGPGGGVSEGNHGAQREPTGARETGPRAHAATVPEHVPVDAKASPTRTSTATQSAVVTQAAPNRRVRRRDPTMQISAAELATITIDDEGTTMGVQSGTAEARRRVAVTSEYDLSVEVALPGADDDEASGPFLPVSVRAAGATHVGKKGKHNGEPMGLDEVQAVYVLADGMGGYAAGEVASQMCVDTILRSYKTGDFGGDPILGLPPRGDELVRAIQTANTEILTESRANESRAGMGTTVVAARFMPTKQRLYIAHVGDSRLYRVRKDELVQLTTDHTLGQQGVTGPAAQKLSRAVGVFDEIEVDLNIDVPEPGDVYLICSDGLFKMVHELRIVEILAEQQDAEKAAQSLVDEANARGGKDNISVIVLRVAMTDLRKLS